MKLGLFDSGVGGLTVLSALRSQFPNVDIAYLGDTARVPYGTKSNRSIQQYSEQAVRCLRQEKHVDAVIIACNTASALAVKPLNDCFPSLDIFSVIEPGAQAALQSLSSKKTKSLIGVLATESTINGRAYTKAIQRHSPNTQIVGQACQMLVALAEEGWIQGEIAGLICRRYLKKLFDQENRWPESIILGCTHFPLMQDMIRQAALDLGASKTCIIDSSLTIAQYLSTTLGSKLDTGRGLTEYLVTDGITRFVDVGSRFLGQSIDRSSVELVNLQRN